MLPQLRISRYLFKCFMQNFVVVIQLERFHFMFAFFLPNLSSSRVSIRPNFLTLLRKSIMGCLVEISIFRLACRRLGLSVYHFTVLIRQV